MGDEKVVVQIVRTNKFIKQRKLYRYIFNFFSKPHRKNLYYI